MDFYSLNILDPLCISRWFHNDAQDCSSTKALTFSFRESSHSRTLRRYTLRELTRILLTSSCNFALLSTLQRRTSNQKAKRCARGRIPLDVERFRARTPARRFRSKAHRRGALSGSPPNPPRRRNATNKCRASTRQDTFKYETHTYATYDQVLIKQRNEKRNTRNIPLIVSRFHPQEGQKTEQLLLSTVLAKKKTKTKETLHAPTHHLPNSLPTRMKSTKGEKDTENDQRQRPPTFLVGKDGLPVRCCTGNCLPPSRMQDL